jgi:hypothetical protein
MVFCAPPIRLLVLAVLAGGAPAGACAQVAAKSPFLPPAGAAPAATATTDAPIEFRGLMEMGGALQFRLFDPARKAGSWVKLDERNAELEVLAKKHDSTAETLTVEFKGRTLTLAMRKPKVVSAGSAPAMPPPPSASAPPPAVNVMPAVTQSVVLNPTPADEQRRLEAVAAEVARRRALREQATQQLNQGAAPGAMMPPPGVRPGMPPPQPR